MKKTKRINNKAVFDILKKYALKDLGVDDVAKECSKKIADFYEDTFDADLFDDEYLLFENTLPYNILFNYGIKDLVGFYCTKKTKDLVEELLKPLKATLYNLLNDSSTYDFINLEEDSLIEILQNVFNTIKLFNADNVGDVYADDIWDDELKRQYKKELDLDDEDEDVEEDEDEEDEE